MIDDPMNNVLCACVFNSYEKLDLEETVGTEMKRAREREKTEEKTEVAVNVCDCFLCSTWDL